MLHVTVSVLGSDADVREDVEEGTTIGDLKSELGLENYTACTQGEPVDDDHEVMDFDWVSLSAPVKGGVTP